MKEDLIVQALFSLGESFNSLEAALKVTRTQLSYLIRLQVPDGDFVESIHEKAQQQADQLLASASEAWHEMCFFLLRAGGMSIEQARKKTDDAKEELATQQRRLQQDYEEKILELKKAILLESLDHSRKGS